MNGCEFYLQNQNSLLRHKKKGGWGGGSGLDKLKLIVPGQDIYLNHLNTYIYFFIKSFKK